MHRMTAILPCNDMDRSQKFYERLGFACVRDHGNYRILSDGNGADLHLTTAVKGWLVAGRNPFGLYLYAENVEELAERMGELVLHPPELKPWGMFEFAMSDPEETLVRVGRRAEDVVSAE